jgi:hypothetical protein
MLRQPDGKGPCRAFAENYVTLNATRTWDSGTLPNARFTTPPEPDTAYYVTRIDHR